MFSIVANCDASHRPLSLPAYTINPPISSTCSIRNSFGILRQRTRAHYQRDAKDEYACEHSIEWDDNEKESSDSIAFPASLTAAKVGAGHPQRTIGFIPFLQMYIDREECPQAEQTRDNSFLSTL